MTEKKLKFKFKCTAFWKYLSFMDHCNYISFIVVLVIHMKYKIKSTKQLKDSYLLPVIPFVVYGGMMLSVSHRVLPLDAHLGAAVLLHLALSLHMYCGKYVRQ